MKSLKDLKVKELRDIAKTFNIVGRWDMKKAELIDAIEKAKSILQNNMSMQEVNCPRKEEGSMKVKTENAVEEGFNKKSYINNMEIGVLVAFKTGEKVKSAKLVKKSTKNKMVLVETKVGKQFKISYDDIIWVKTGRRWPRGVYRLLKGIETING